MIGAAVLSILGAATFFGGEEQPLWIDVRGLEAELGVPAQLEAGPGPDPCFVVRIGAANVPSVAVILVPDAEGSGPSVETRGGKGPREVADAVLAHRKRAERARSSLDALARGYAELGAEPSFALELVLPRSSAAESSGVEFDANFPAGWRAARAERGPHAGYYPGQRADVAGIVDWLLDTRRSSCVGVVALRAQAGGRPAGAPAEGAPGSLERFTVEGLGRAFGAAVDANGATAVASTLFARAPRLTLDPPTVRRIGPSSWVIESRSTVQGAVAGSAPTSSELEFSVRGHTRAWVACAVEDDAGALRVRAVRRGAARFDLASKPRRIRLVLNDPELLGTEEVLLHLRGVGAVGSRVAVSLKEAPAEGAAEAR